MPPTVSTEQIESLARIERAMESQQIRLEAIERRLGTDQESATDFDEAREIAHKLSNLKGLLALTKTRPAIATV